MIKILFMYKNNVNNKWITNYKIFTDKTKALRFMYATNYKFFNFEWVCDDPEDNDYLNQKYKG